MDIDEFIKIFKESFDELNEEISPSTKFKELEYWTSMQALLLIAHVDDTLVLKIYTGFTKMHNGSV
jgi:acyl carrier protein